MNVSTGNILNAFYELFLEEFPTIYKYGHPPNLPDGEFMVLNFIPNNRDKIRTSETTKIIDGYGFTYATAFIPKINNGTDIYPDSKRIETVQNDINTLIDSFSTTEKVNSMSLYLETEPTVTNDLNTHSAVIFRITTKYC